uniref:Uncharacterized protein n=1 Tax=Meloidogyne enterolobii TaxID=390850 RepID=A0A6V7TXF7_MELEN|nr:unnamed protein product [Meloidogyne enterolobii]
MRSDSLFIFPFTALQNISFRPYFSSLLHFWHCLGWMSWGWLSAPLFLSWQRLTGGHIINAVLACTSTIKAFIGNFHSSHEQVYADNENSLDTGHNNN